jgi:hypothetical protein
LRDRRNWTDATQEPSDGGGQAELDATMPVVESIEFEVAG